MPARAPAWRRSFNQLFEFEGSRERTSSLGRKGNRWGENQEKLTRSARRKGEFTAAGGDGEDRLAIPLA